MTSSRTRTLIGLTALTLAAVLLLADAPRAQDDVSIFDDRVLHRVQLSIHSRDLAELRARFDENTFYPADLVWGDLRVRNVGVRSRGTGSRNPTKLGLLVEFGRYTKGQRFLGLSSLVLDNLYQDASLLREPLAMALLRRLGFAAPRESYAHVSINGVPQGLYAIVEPITAEFLQETLGTSGGTLFEYHYRFPFYGEALGDDLSIYPSIFEPQGGASGSAEALFGPLRDLFRDINDPDDETWVSRVEARLDLPDLLRYVATEAFLAEHDGLLGYEGMNNFYVYRDPGTTRHRVLAWDKDFAFTFLDTSIFLRADENVLMRRALERPELLALYLDAADAAAQAALADGWLASEIDRLATLIQPAVIKDQRKPFTNQDFLDSVEFLRAFAAVRPGLVTEEVALAREEGLPPPPAGVSTVRPPTGQTPSGRPAKAGRAGGRGGSR